MVKLDLTSDELLVLEPITREVAHPYSDNPPGGIHVPCYAFEEIFAEKMRALAERCRPRDLYDVVHLYRREEAETVAPEVTRVLAAKCKYKGIEVPRLSSLNRRRDELVADWSNMLAHQVQVLPPIDDFWNELQLVFAALEGPAPRPRPTPIHAPAAGAAILRGEAVRGAVHLPAGPSAMERLYFAAANRLCVDLGYNARVRRIEPYSLRRTRDGHLLLYGCKATTGETRAYRVDRIQSVAVAHQGFSPRHIVELTDRGPLSIPPARYRQSVSGMSIGRRRLAPSSTSRRGFGKPAGGAPGGLRHIYECPVCGRRFTRQQRSNSLRPHKTKDGFPCPGRRATFVESRC